MENQIMDHPQTHNGLQPQLTQNNLQFNQDQNSMQPQLLQQNNLQSNQSQDGMQSGQAQISVQSNAITENDLQAIQTQTNLPAPLLQTNLPALQAPSGYFQPNQTQANLMPQLPQANLQPDQTQITMTGSPQKSTITKVKLSDELNIFDWFRTTDIINQIAEKAKHSVDTVITALDPGMKEYLYSGGNINVMVISDGDNLVSPIRDAFQSAFGRATVTAARYKSPESALGYPIRLASGLNEAILVALERIKRLRSETNDIPQNQVIVAVQPCVLNLIDNEGITSSITYNGMKLSENLQPKWFLTYCMIIEDPVLLTTMNSYSQFIPLDNNTITTAKEATFPDSFQDKHLGYAISVDDIMNSRLRIPPKESGDLEDCQWLKVWSGLSESQIIRDLSYSLAHLYRRKWDECVN